jgi:hypothetical protein
LPLFGVNPQIRAQLLQDFSQALVNRNTENVTTTGNVTNADAELDQDEVRSDDEKP